MNLDSIVSIGRALARMLQKKKFRASRRWAISFKNQFNLRYRKPTTNRTVTAQYIFEEGGKFYADLARYRRLNKDTIDARLVFNVD